MYFSKSYALTTTLPFFAVATFFQGAFGVWPQPSKVIAFWPLNSVYSTRDAGPNVFTTSQGSTVTIQSAKPGPFGDNGTAASCPSHFLYTPDSRVFLVYSSFTISFFIFANGKEGGIMELGEKTGLQMYYTNYTDLVITGPQKRIIGSYRIIQRNVWTYIAIKFDYDTGSLALYGSLGLVYQEKFTPDIYTALATGNHFLTARVYTTSNAYMYMSSGDMLSCVMIYKTPLNAAEIEQVHDACRAIHGSPAAGQPRVPLSPIPDKALTLVKQGQMPWMVSVRNISQEHECSGTIMSEYFIITSLKCSEKANYIIAAEHDVSYPELNEQLISVKRVIPYPDQEFDLALLELATPINFASILVNNLGFRTSAHTGTYDYYVAGWGVNGRDALVSNGAPRYSYGKTLPDANCATKWGQIGGQNSTYNATKYVCMLPVSNKQVPCNGDEGSALLAAVPNFQSGDYHLVMFGVYSKRDDACTDTMPGFYVNILSTIPWISSVVACAIPGNSYYPFSCPM